MSDPFWGRDEWNIGVVQQSAADLVRSGLRGPVHWLEADPWRILADPFCYKRSDGRYVVLAEMLNHWVGRGEIWAAVLPENGRLTTADFAPLVRSPVHLSYPVVVQDDTGAFLSMESWEAGGLHLWRADGVYVKKLIDGPIVDPTFYWANGYWFLFCTLQDDHPNERLHLFYSAALTGEWRAHPQNPVKCDLASARPAGAILMVDGHPVRPAQNCSVTYGGALTLNRITCLTPERFEETSLAALSPQAPYGDGIHTLAAAGEFTVIDGKRWHTGLAANVVRKGVAKAFKATRSWRRGGFVGQTRWERPSPLT